MLNLTCGRWSATLAARSGGSLAKLRLDDIDILRPASPRARLAGDMACFPMLPYVGRIADGRFSFAGQDHRLPINFAPVPHHSLHGPGWQSIWTVDEVGGDFARLSHQHQAGPAWPFAYGAWQNFILTREGLSLSLGLTNADTSPMPASIGLHPFLPIDQQTRLKFLSDSLWLNNEAGLPDHAVSPDRFGDFAASAPARTAGGIDNLYDGWNGLAQLDRDEVSIRLQSSAPCLQVFSPGDADFICLEPCSDRPDTVNSTPENLRILRPGESLTLTMAITAETAATPEP